MDTIEPTTALVPTTSAGSADGVALQNGATDPRYAHIAGWGADLDRANRPGVPMERTPPRLEHPPEHDPEPQSSSVRVLHSTERPGLTPIYGTPCPPSGLSGVLREMAFKQSENDIRHWMMLFAADRINVVEGIASDLAKGHVPNVLGEMGIRAAWKHDRNGVIRKGIIATVVLGFVMARMRRRVRA